MAAAARATMDFFAAQQAAKRRTGLLVVYFVLAVLGTAAVIWVGLSAVLAVQTTADLASFSFRGDLAVAVLAMVAIVTGAGAAFHAAEHPRDRRTAARRRPASGGS